MTADDKAMNDACLRAQKRVDDIEATGNKIGLPSFLQRLARALETSSIIAFLYDGIEEPLIIDESAISIDFHGIHIATGSDFYMLPFDGFEPTDEWGSCTAPAAGCSVRLSKNGNPVADHEIEVLIAPIWLDGDHETRVSVVLEAAVTWAKDNEHVAISSLVKGRSLGVAEAGNVEYADGSLRLGDIITIAAEKVGYLTHEHGEHVHVVMLDGTHYHLNLTEFWR